MNRFLFAGVGLVSLAVGLWIGFFAPSMKPVSPDNSSEKAESLDWEPHHLAPSPGYPWLIDVTRSAGIDFIHNGHATPDHLIQETLGSGIGWIDYDNDGWPDLFCVQVGTVASPRSSEPVPTHRLYRNLGNGTFRDVSAETGVNISAYGMGVEVGDYDNDGYDDLLLSELTGVRLLHNEANPQGGRRFKDVTSSSGLANLHWATSCAWGDIDRDGLLDLYVAHYVKIDHDRPAKCRDIQSGLPQSCTPTAYPHVAHRLFRNLGHGTFEDITDSSGISNVPPAPGLGVVMIDLDDDGHLDIFVANDMKPAYLFHNNGNRTFTERAIVSGCGLSGNGSTMAGMGIAVGDLDGTFRPSLFVTNFQNQPNVLFRNLGGLRFSDGSYPSGLGLASLQRLGFGTALLDADRDGRSDLVVVNGHVNRHAKEIDGSTFEQHAQLFAGLGSGKFQDVSHRAGAYFNTKYAGRGVAVADYDRDGRLDLAISSNGGPAILLRNETRNANRGIGLRLQGDGIRSNRNAIGSRIEVATNKSKRVFFVHGGGSYLSSGDRQVLVGLGEDEAISNVLVRWPSGKTQQFRSLLANEEYRFIEGNDSAVLEHTNKP